MDLLEKNLKALQARDVHLADLIKKIKVSENAEVVTSKSGHLVPRINNHTLHSIFDPKKEGERWAESQLEILPQESGVFVVVGFGFGYHLLPFLKNKNLDPIVVEPNPYILRLAMENLDISSLLSQITIVVGRNLEKVWEKIDPETAVISFGPSRYPDPNLYDATLGRIRFRQSFRKLKIMVVSPVYGGSLPITYYCAAALKEIGADVDLMDFSSYQDDLFSINQITPYPGDQNQLRNQMMIYLSNRVMARVMAIKPDLVLFMAQAPVLADLFRKLKAENFPTAFWFVEDYRLFPYWKDVAPFCDYFFTIQKGEILNHLKSLGVNNFHYLPTACQPSIHKNIDLNEEEQKEYGSDISFVGAGYGNRRKFFSGLIDFRFKIWGNDWNTPGKLGNFLQRNGKRVSTEDSVKVFNATKINLNLHSSPACEGIDPVGDFINPRTFELAGCGAFQLVDPRIDLSEFFLPGEELICFTDLADIRKKIIYYLSHENERKNIARKAQERVLREHTYKNRMEEMLGFIFVRGFKPRPTLAGERNVEELLMEAGRETELGQYLSKFPPEKKVTLDDMVGIISEEEGVLKDSEKIFLLLKDFSKMFK